MRMFRVVFETEVCISAENKQQARHMAQNQLYSFEDAYKPTRKISDVEEWYRP